MSYWEVRQIFRAEREVFCGPTAEDDALGPPSCGVGRYGLDGFGNEAHDGVGIVVELILNEMVN